MPVTILVAATFCVVVSIIHITSIAIAACRLRRISRREPRQYPPVSLIRPLCGIDNYAEETLRSTFDLDYPDYEILFCVASANDAVLPLVRRLIAAHAGAPAHVLIGDDHISSNPKLNNVLKGWRDATHDWIIIADSN